MARSSTPQNFEASSGTLFEDYETFGSFTGAGTSGSIAADTTNFKTGAQGLQITSTNGGYYATKTISLNAQDSGVWGMWVYVPSTTNMFGITLYLSSNASFTSFFSYQWGVSVLKNGWNFLSVGRNSFTNTGSESWSNTMIRSRVRVDTIASQTSTATFDSLYYGVYARPKVVIMFDDCFTSAYTVGYPYMDAYGMKGSFGVCSSLIDTANYMTTANLQTAYANGWDVINHTANHNNISAYTAQQVADEVKPCTTYLRSQGFTRNGADNLFIYPQGGYSTTAITELQAEGFVSARGTINNRQNTIKGVDAPMLISAGEMRSDTVTLNTAKGWVDDAIANGRTLFIFGHKIVTTPAVFTEWATADFQSLIDYIAGFSRAQALDVVTYSEWYKGLTAPRRSAVGRSAATGRLSATGRITA